MSTNRLTIDSVLLQLEDAMHHYADQPLKIDSMGVTRAWRAILEDFLALRSLMPSSVGRATEAACAECGHGRGAHVHYEGRCGWCLTCDHYVAPPNITEGPHANTLRNPSNVTENTQEVTQSNITINGRPMAVQQETLTYREIIDLAFGRGTNRNYTITYHSRAVSRHAGALYAFDESIEVEDGMVFDVAFTGSA